MGHIHILPQILSNKIAAGEVVERPASVVKELVENALDAGGARIVIEVKLGGKSLIRVTDDGDGMRHDDALLSLERYATSKISTDRDLFDIRTLGFRGEALPSIASVSRFSIVTRAKDADTGTEIVVDGGRIRQVSETGAPTGTMITVRQLFYNTPARRKFLKSANTEMSHVADTLSGIAMSWPGVHFRLLHNDKAVRNWSAAPDPANRVADVLGRDVGPHLMAVTANTPAVSLTGWLAAAGITRSTSRGIYVYVNGRFVRDRLIRHALFDGYAGRLMKGRYPLAALFLEVPFDRVDVNVHPTKHEVRFVEQRAVHDTVARAVAETLSKQERPPRVRAVTETLPKQEHPPREWAVSETISRQEQPPGVWAVAEKATNQPRPQIGLWQGGRFAEARVVGQYHGTYILLETEEGLLLVDQHAAHERVLFEHFQARAAGAGTKAQRLLVPETVELGFREADALGRLVDDLNGMGFEIEPFGGATFVVKAVPALLAGKDVRPLILEIAETAATVGFGAQMEKALDECRMLMACHGSIRANQTLSDRQVHQLMTDLDRCRTPAHCPHGRPTFIRWTLRELEKAFGRVV